MAEKKPEDVGLLVLRVSLGALMLFHGVHKISAGVGGITGMLEAKGLPQFLAYGVFIGEILAPALMIVGWYTRAAAAVFALNMLVAIFLAHSGDIFKLGTNGQWAIELPALYLFGAVAVLILGPGRLSVSRG